MLKIENVQYAQLEHQSLYDNKKLRVLDSKMEQKWFTYMWKLTEKVIIKINTWLLLSKKIAGWGVLDIDKNTNHKMRPPALKIDQERDMCLGHP